LVNRHSAFPASNARQKIQASRVGDITDVRPKIVLRPGGDRLVFGARSAD
jgi:hypothetical protein